MNARAAAERTSTASPSARLEGGVVAVVEADLAREEPVLVELGVTGAGDRIHLVGALPGEADAGRAVAAVQAALDRAEDELPPTLGFEANVGIPGSRPPLRTGRAQPATNPYYGCRDRTLSTVVG